MNRRKNVIVAGKAKPVADAKLCHGKQKDTAAMPPINKKPQPKPNIKKAEPLPKKTSVQRSDATTRKISGEGFGGRIGVSGKAQSRNVAQAAKATRSEAQFRIVKVDERTFRRGANVKLGKLASESKIMPKNLKRVDLEVAKQLPRKITTAKQCKPSKIPLNVNRKAATDCTKDVDKALRVMHAQLDPLHVTDESEVDTKTELSSNISEEDVEIVMLKEPPQNIEKKEEAKAETEAKLKLKVDLNRKESTESKEVNMNVQVNANTTESVLAAAAVVQAKQKIEELMSLEAINMSENKSGQLSSRSQLLFSVPAITVKPQSEKIWNAASIKPQWSGLIREQTISRSGAEDIWHTPRTDLHDLKKITSLPLHIRNMGKYGSGEVKPPSGELD